MNWQAVTAIAESVGAAGMIVSLIYLAVQVRHNTKQALGAVPRQWLRLVPVFQRRLGSTPSHGHIG